MAFIPATNTVRVAFQMTQDLQQVQNVVYVQDSTPWSVTKMDTLAAILVSWWETYMAPTQPASVALRQITLRDMSVETGVEVVFTTGLPLVGESPGVPLPNSVTVAIKLNTGLGGRSYRGRQYIVGLTELNLNADRNTITDGTVTYFTEAYDQLIAEVEADYTPGLVVASFSHDNALRTTAELTKVINAKFTDNVLDTQRRRLPGRGR